MTVKLIVDNDFEWDLSKWDYLWPPEDELCHREFRFIWTGALVEVIWHCDRCGVVGSSAFGPAGEASGVRDQAEVLFMGEVECLAGC